MSTETLGVVVDSSTGEDYRAVRSGSV
jgi:hypothetical protein